MLWEEEYSPHSARLGFDSCPGRPAGNAAVWARGAIEMPACFPEERTPSSDAVEPSLGLLKESLSPVCLSTTTCPLPSFVRGVSYLMGRNREPGVTCFVVPTMQFLTERQPDHCFSVFFFFLFLFCLA